MLMVDNFGLPEYWYYVMNRGIMLDKGIMMDNFGLPMYLYLGNRGIMLDNVGLPMYLIKVFGVLEYLNKILRRSSMQKVFGVPKYVIERGQKSVDEKRHQAQARGGRSGVKRWRRSGRGRR